MKTLLLALILIPCMAWACDDRELYLKIGAGYKVDQDKYTHIADGSRYYYRYRDPYSARIELGIEQGRWTYGISHHSQWASGFPFNDRGEPHKTEIFLDYKWSVRL